MRKLHPTDVRDAAIFEAAVSYSVALFLGQGRYARAEAETMEQARAEAKRLERENPGRTAMIYGVNAAGRSAMLTPLMEAFMAAKKTQSKKQTAGRALADAMAPVLKPKAKAAAAAPAPRISAPKVPQIAPLKGMTPLGVSPPVQKGETKVAKGADVHQLSLDAKRWDNARFTDDELQVLFAHFHKRLPSKSEMKSIDTTIIALARRSMTVEEAKAILRKAKTPTPAAPAAAKAGPKKAAASSKAAIGKRAQAEADARAGKMPVAPDFSADTHARWREKLAEVVKLAKAGDLKGLKAFKIDPISSSRKAIDRFRQLAVLALEAKAAKK